MSTETPALTGPQLRAIRAQLGYSAPKLASELHVGVGTISAWERGKDPIPRGVTVELIDIADIQQEHARSVARQLRELINTTKVGDQE